MTAVKLREWRGVKPVPGPSGAAITTRLRTTPEDDTVLDAVAGHLGRLRRADLAHVCRPMPPGPRLDDEARRQARRDVLNARKQAITAESSSRWAGTIIRANDDQYRLARQSQARHIVSLGAAISSIEKRLAQPTSDVLAREDRKTRRGQTKEYATQAERFQKQRRLQSLRAELGRVMADRDDKFARVVDGGKRLAKTRHNLSTAGLAEAEWRERWSCARWRIEANGSGDEPFGNLTITVTPTGEVSLRLPKPLEHLANAKRGRYVLSGRAKFAYRAAEWQARTTGGKSVSYALTRKPGRSGVYLTAAWATPDETFDVTAGTADGEVLAAGPVVAVDLNDGHLAIRRLDGHGNPVGSPWRIDFGLTGTTARRDAQVRHRSHGSSATACGTAPAPSPSRTSTSPMRGRPAGRRWAEASAASGSVAPWPASPPQSSATGLPGRPADTASACSRSIPPTRRRGETSTGASRTRTSPATRQPPP